MPPTTGTTSDSEAAASPSPTPTRPAEPRVSAKFGALPTPPDALVRRRLLDVLRDGVRRPLTLVSAPAGYGKTVLVSTLGSSLDRVGTALYLTMDDGDTAPAEFWGSVLECLRRRGVDVTDVHPSGTSEVVDGRMLTRLAGRIVEHERPVVLVLDCGELPLPPVVGDGLNRLLAACAGRLRLVFLTRTDPPLPLHRYRLRDEVTEIRADDLSFTLSEVAVLMRRAGLDLEPVDVAALHARTGGWPAGLKFAAMALAGRADPHRAAQEFRGDTGNVAAFLMSEVLAKQPPETRELLLRTCLVDELDPGLVTALTGRHCDPRTLQFMAHGNSFIEQVPGRPGHYRYQSLFREFLRSQVEYEWPGLVPELHRTAAEWLARDGRLLVAIRPAASAQAWPIATRCFVEGFGVGRLLIGPRRAVLHDLLGGLPDDVEGADAAVTRAALAVADVDLDLAEAALVEVRSLPSREESPRSPALALTVLVLEAVAGSMDPDLDAGLDAVLRAENALSLAPADDRVARPELEIVLAGCRGRVLLQRGDLGAALAALTRGVRLAEAARLEEAAAQLQGMAALAEAMTGRLRKAAEIAAEWGAQDDTGSGPSYSSRAAVLALAWARMDQYDLGAVQDLLALSEPAACSPYDARLLGALGTLLRARLLRAQGRPELARAGIRAVSAPDRSTPVSGRLARSLVLEEAACLVQEHRPQEAVETLRTTEAADAVEAELLLEPATLAAGPVPEQTRRPAGALAGEPLATQIAGWLVLTCRAARRPDRARAEAFLARALETAAPERLRRPFLEAPEEVRELLGHGAAATRHGWLRTTEPAPTADEHALVGAQGSPVTGGSRAGPAPAVPPLTAKEQEVLGYLAQLLTTDEIAATMFVSVNTVRSHVRSILRKLGVTRRNQAVRRAWELQLLPPRDAA